MLHVPAILGSSVGGGELGGDGRRQRHRERSGAVGEHARGQRRELRRAAAAAWWRRRRRPGASRAGCRCRVRATPSATTAAIATARTTSATIGPPFHGAERLTHASGAVLHCGCQSRPSRWRSRALTASQPRRRRAREQRARRCRPRARSRRRRASGAAIETLQHEQPRRRARRAASPRRRAPRRPNFAPGPPTKLASEARPVSVRVSTVVVSSGTARRCAAAFCTPIASAIGTSSA